MNNIIRTNQFYLKGQLLPAIITSIPIVYLLYGIIKTYLNDNLFFQSYSFIPETTKTLLFIGISFAMVLVNRTLSKEIFQNKHFKDELHMPTTNLLLLKDKHFDHTTKNRIRKKIKTLYEISLLGEQGEASDEKRARKLIVSAVSCIRNSLRENKILLKYNIEYSFIRNSIGGCIPAMLASILVLILGYSGKISYSVYWGWSFLILSLTVIALSKPLMNIFGKYYAKTLYEQFLSLKQ
jgi:hypothetical protein